MKLLSSLLISLLLFTSLAEASHFGLFFGRGYRKTLIDDNFDANTGTGADSIVASIAVQSDNKILISGYFMAVTL